MWVAIENALFGLDVKREIVSEKVYDMAPLGDREDKRRRPHGKVLRRLRPRLFLPFFYHVISIPRHYADILPSGWLIGLPHSCEAYQVIAALDRAAMRSLPPFVSEPWGNVSGSTELYRARPHSDARSRGHRHHRKSCSSQGDWGGGRDRGRGCDGALFAPVFTRSQPDRTTLQQTGIKDDAAEEGNDRRKGQA